MKRYPWTLAILLGAVLSGCGGEPVNDLGLDIHVLPNPATREELELYAEAYPDPTDPTGLRVTFANLPVTPCRVILYDQYSEIVAEVEKSGDQDRVSWNLRTDTGQQVSPGIYQFTVRAVSDDTVLARGTFFASP